MEWIKDLLKTVSGIKTFLGFSAFIIAVILIFVLQAPAVAVTPAGVAIIIMMILMIPMIKIFDILTQHYKRQEKIIDNKESEKLTLLKEYNVLFQDMVIEITKMNQNSTFINDGIKDLKEDNKKIVSITECIDNNTSHCWVNSKKPKRNSN
jgi:hypothetical protein